MEIEIIELRNIEKLIRKVHDEIKRNNNWRLNSQRDIFESHQGHKYEELLNKKENELQTKRSDLQRHILRNVKLSEEQQEFLNSI